MSIPHENDSVKGLGAFSMHRKETEKLADVYKHLFEHAQLAADLDRWEKREDYSRHCGTFLSFDVYENIAGTRKKVLSGANFCRLALCPMCQWRRGLRLYTQMLRVWRFIFEDYREIEFDKSNHRLKPRLRAILLTLTVPNVPAGSLRDTVAAMSEGWNRLNKSKGYPEWKTIHGYYKALEVTYNSKADTYHPHYHVLCLVDEEYFRSGYVKQERWLDIWRQCMRDQSITQVDVRALRGSTPQAMLKNLNETCKYTVKPSDFLRGSMDEQAKVVETLDRALQGVRRASFGGWLKSARTALKLDDVENIEHDEKPSDDWKRVSMVWLHWASGVGDYVE